MSNRRRNREEKVEKEVVELKERKREKEKYLNYLHDLGIEVFKLTDIIIKSEGPGGRKAYHELQQLNIRLKLINEEFSNDIIQAIDAHVLLSNEFLETLFRTKSMKEDFFRMEPLLQKSLEKVFRSIGNYQIKDSISI